MWQIRVKNMQFEEGLTEREGLIEGSIVSTPLEYISLKGTSNDKTSFIILKDLDFNNKNMKK